MTAFVFAILVFDKSPNGGPIVADSIFRDRWAALAQILVAGCGLVAVLIAYSEQMREENIAEYYVLLAAAGAGMAFFVQAANLMTLFLGLEWFSIALYVMCAIDIDLVGSLEAGLKYLVVGAVGSATLLFGSALVYGATGELSFDKIAAAGHTHDSLLVLGLAMMIAGFAFKASAAPFHMWTPDAYQGAPTPVTAFMSSATKVAALVVMLRVLLTAFPGEEHLWTWAVAGIAIISLAVGNIAALAQRNVKRLLAYSSVSHAGFMLIAVSVGERDRRAGAHVLPDPLLRDVARRVRRRRRARARARGAGDAREPRPASAGSGRSSASRCGSSCSASSASRSPAGSGGRSTSSAAAYDKGWWWLIVIGVVFTMVSAAYYLAVVRSMFLRDSAELRLAPAGGSPPREWLLQKGVAICAIVTVGSFFFVQPLVDLASKAASALPF